MDNMAWGAEGVRIEALRKFWNKRVVAGLLFMLDESFVLGEATCVSEMLTSLVSLMKGQWLLLQVGSFRGGHRGLQQIREVTRAWGQGGCNRLGKVEKKVQCCSSVGEWMCGGKLKGDPKNNTVIFFAWGCGGESGK